RVFELGNSTDVTGVQLRDRRQVLALWDGEMGKLFRATAGEVLHRGVVLDHAGKDFEVSDTSGKGIIGGAEDKSGGRLGICYLALGPVAVAGGVWRGVNGGVLGRGGTVIHDEIQKMVGAHVAQARSKEHRKDLVVANGFVQRGNQVLFGNR